MSESYNSPFIIKTKKRGAKNEYEFYGIKVYVEQNGSKWDGITLPQNGMTLTEPTKRELLAQMEAECQRLASDEGINIEFNQAVV
jgi:hypothetical protein